MTVFKTMILLLASLVGYTSIQAQQEPVISAIQSEKGTFTIPVQEDSLNQNTLTAPTKLPGDNPLEAGSSIQLSRIDSLKRQLEDLPEAAQYDRKWMKELQKNVSLYQEMVTAVQQPDTTANPLDGFTTEILKERLAALNEKTPFNVEYNPALESVIKSFLRGKKDLMERMITASQFYFPMFEQELDNYNIPMEIKYLAVVESALNPRARSRVGATGLWQFMYSTGRMYKLDVSSYACTGRPRSRSMPSPRPRAARSGARSGCRTRGRHRGERALPRGGCQRSRDAPTRRHPQGCRRHRRRSGASSGT